MATELDAAPLGTRIDPDTRRRVLEDGVAAIGPFGADGGRVELPSGATW